MDGDLELPEVAGKTRTPLPLQNSYAAKKTVVQGFMDIALIMANANQMRYVIEYNFDSRGYYLLLILISGSLLLQVAVGISLIFKGRCDLSGDSKLEQANRINNYVLAAVFLITVLNIFITAFSSTPAPASLVRPMNTANPEPPRQ